MVDLKLIDHGHIRTGVQVRKFFGDVSELACLIRAGKQIEPITVMHQPCAEAPERPWKLIKGERRWRAVGMIIEEDLREQREPTITQLPCLIEQPTPLDHDLMQIRENLGRKQLTPWEKAVAYQRLMRVHGLSKRELVETLGSDSTQVSRYLSLLNLQGRVREHLEKFGGAQVPLATLIEWSRKDLDGQEREFDKWLGSVQKNKTRSGLKRHKMRDWETAQQLLRDLKAANGHPLAIQVVEYLLRIRNQNPILNLQLPPELQYRPPWSDPIRLK
jgi:ParB/RepB/Spo0J family partition protein